MRRAAVPGAMVPYQGQLVQRLLTKMSDEMLAVAEPTMFQIHPAEVIESGRTLGELIDNERARRAKC